ncbi:MAG: hypothetical protein WCV90_07850 [Candidatus Woesearchaeota archaeon]
MFKKKLVPADFSVAENNNVTAVYVVNPRILELDNPSMRGKPFVFYRGSNHQDQRAEEIDVRNLSVSDTPVRPFVGKGRDLDSLLEGRNEAGTKGVAKVPEAVTIKGEYVPVNHLRSGLVPFSFGASHKNDCERYLQTNGNNIRRDLDAFKQVLVRYDAQMAEEATLGYKVRHLLGGK